MKDDAQDKADRLMRMMQDRKEEIDKAWVKLEEDARWGWRPFIRFVVMWAALMGLAVLIGWLLS